MTLLLAAAIGFYQWVGVEPRADSADLLTQARRQTRAAGSRLFRLYLGPRYDYIHHPGAVRFETATPAAILALPRYRAVIEDPGLDTVIITTYSAADYGAGPDDLNLLRPWGAAADKLERAQVRELCDYLYAQFGALNKTVVIANSEADDKLLEIMNYTGSPERAIANLVAWTRARHESIEQARTAHPAARLRVLHGFEVSLVNLKIAREGPRFRKSARGEWNALVKVVPQVRYDLLLYSSYESINSPYETQNKDTPPAEIAARLSRDLDRLRDAGRASLTPLGRRLFGGRFVAIGELGFARDTFEAPATGGVLPRLVTGLGAARTWGCPYIVLWQVFDAPRTGREAYGWGMIDRDGNAPRLKPAASGCSSVRACVMEFVREKR